MRNWHLDRVHNSMASLRRVSGNAAQQVKNHLKGAAHRAKATTYLWKLSAGSVVAEYKATARVTRAACKAKMAPVAAKMAPAVAACKEKAASAAMVCSDLARVAGVSSYRSARKNWDKASEWGKESWEKAGVVASRVRVRVDRHPVSPLLYITLLCVGIGAVAFNGMYTKAYVAYVNGEEVGVVSSEEELSSIVGNVETRVASVLGEEYSYDAEITLAPTYLDAGTQTNARAVEDALFEDTGAMMNAYAVSVDGQELGYAQTSEELQTMLDNGYCTEDELPHTALAWDLVRVINLARWAYLCGYISEEEMWQVMGTAAGIAHERFASWKEYGLSFVFGRGVWHGEPADSETAYEIVSTLLEKDESPWQQSAWK